MGQRPERVLYEARAYVDGGRRGGRARSASESFDLELQAPEEIGGPGTGTNPEELFAAAYGGCFLSTMQRAMRERELDVVPVTLHASVSLVKGKFGYQLAVRLRAECAELLEDELRAVMGAAHELCPFSRAIDGNVDVEFEAVGAEAPTGS